LHNENSEHTSCVIIDICDDQVTVYSGNMKRVFKMIFEAVYSVEYCCN